MLHFNLQNPLISHSASIIFPSRGGASIGNFSQYIHGQDLKHVVAILSSHDEEHQECLPILWQIQFISIWPSSFVMKSSLETCFFLPRGFILKIAFPLDYKPYEGCRLSQMLHFNLQDPLISHSTSLMSPSGGAVVGRFFQSVQGLGSEIHSRNIKVT